MKRKLALASLVLLLAPVWAAAQERPLPLVARVGSAFPVPATGGNPTLEPSKRPGVGAESTLTLGIVVSQTGFDCGPLQGNGRTRETTGGDCGSPDQTRANNPIPGVTIIVENNPGGTLHRTTTDAEGRFTFRNLALGEYVLRFTQPGAAVTTGSSTRAGSAPWTPHVELTMEVTERGNVFRGKITEDQDPRPTDRACVTGRVTNASGGPETSCRADATLSDGSSVQEQSTRGHFRTRGRYAAATVRGLAVTARSNSSDVILQTRTNDEGEFAFRDLAPGEYVLAIAESGLTMDAGAASELRIVMSESGLASDPSDPSGNIYFIGTANGGVWKAPAGVTVELTREVTERGNTLYGRVSDNENPQDQLRTSNPISGVDIVVRKESPSPATTFQTTTDSGGAFSFANLAPGQYVLELVQSREIPGAELNLEVIAANNAPRSLDGSTIMYTGLELMWSPHVELKTQVTERGNILAGRVTNETTGKDCTGPPRTGLTLDAQQGNDQLRTGEPSRGTHVIIAQYSGIRFETTTDADGAFSFPNLAPGKYVLQFAQPATIPGAQWDLSVNENRIAIGGEGVQTWNPHVELRMKATQPGNVLTGRVTFEFDNNSDVARTTGRNCESVSRPRETR
jgi:protocatechuate 3,4-dioxygenase beta subunit